MELQANRIYTVEETAEILSIRRETLLKLIYAKNLEASKLGRLWRIKGSNIDRFLDNTSNISNDDNIEKSRLEKEELKGQMACFEFGDNETSNKCEYEFHFTEE